MNPPTFDSRGKLQIKQQDLLMKAIAWASQEPHNSSAFASSALPVPPPASPEGERQIASEEFCIICWLEKDVRDWDCLSYSLLQQPYPSFFFSSFLIHSFIYSFIGFLRQDFSVKP